MSGEIKVQFTLEEARAVGTMQPGAARDSGRRKINCAVAEHEAHIGPAGLPWCVEPLGDNSSSCCVVDCNGHAVAVGAIARKLTYREAALIAAAAELEDECDAWVRSSEGEDVPGRDATVRRYDATVAVLKKTGRRG